jgi:hypothetical protein
MPQVDILSSSTNESYHFPFANWFDSKNGLSHEIWRDGVVGGANCKLHGRRPTAGAACCVGTPM